MEVTDDMKQYFKNIRSSVQTLSNGMQLTLRYLWESRESRSPIGIEDPTYFDQDKGIATLQYPYESLPVPDNGRYRLHNEVEDCIVCDKCAKICPVNCIAIEPIRAVEEMGVTSDGSVKRIHAAKFDIDMGKCCFCGLCTTVCPTECLTMTKTYDFSEFDVADHNYAFSEMTPLEILEKKAAFAKYEKEKAERPKPQGQARPRPMTKPNLTTQSPEGEGQVPEGNGAKVKPVFRPKPSDLPKTNTEDGTD
ncbi:MAG: formate hydrogenlyase subunit 6/NADH:ubiquinone oxidoreductase subunit I [Cyclobacteriaceae bacterium]